MPLYRITNVFQSTNEMTGFSFILKFVKSDVQLQDKRAFLIKLLSMTCPLILITDYMERSMR